MSLHFILLFSTTVFVASIIPGPSMLLALTHGMQYGARKTIASALGNLSVTVLQATISMIGLGTILIASESIFRIIKYAGASYLIFMGIMLLVSSKTPFQTESVQSSGQETTLKKIFLQGALVTAGNPKAIVFFTAVFPQFIKQDISFLVQAAILLGIGSVIAFGCFMIYAIGGQKIVLLFSGVRAGKVMKRIIGSTFIGSGIGLAASQR